MKCASTAQSDVASASFWLDFADLRSMVLVILSSITIIASGYLWVRSSRAETSTREILIHTVALGVIGTCFVGGALAKSTNVPFFVDWIDILSLVFGWTSVAICALGCFMTYRAYALVKLATLPLSTTPVKQSSSYTVS